MDAPTSELFPREPSAKSITWRNLAFRSSDEIQVEANVGAIGDAPPSYQGLISGPSTRPKIVKRLLAHGFSLVSEDDERHSSYLTGECNGSKIAVTVRSILVDDAYFVGKARTANATGVLVEID